MKQKVIHIPQNLYDDLIYIAKKKSLGKKEALAYAIRLSKSFLDSDQQLEGEIATLFAGLRGIPRDSKREIAFIIRNMSRLNRSLSIITEMQREDIEEYKYLIRNK